LGPLGSTDYKVATRQTRVRRRAPLWVDSEPRGSTEERISKSVGARHQKASHIVQFVICLITVGYTIGTLRLLESRRATRFFA